MTNRLCQLFFPSFLLILAMIGPGCMMGPDLARPANLATEAGGYANDPLAASEGAISLEVQQSGPWWERFADPTTVRLVEEALANNPDLLEASARAMEARALLAGARGARLPGIDGSFSRDRRKSTFTLPGSGRVGVLTTTWDLNFAVSYQVDTWGKLARAEQAAWAGLLASEGNRLAATHTIVAEVIRARVQIASLQKQLEVTRRSIESLQATLNILEARWEQGVGEPAERRLTRRDLATARADVPAIEQRLALAHNALDVLLGRRPGSGARLADPLPDLPDLQPVPVGLPAALLDRRPDLRATEFRAMAEQARLGVAIGDLYPSLTLTASGGFTADDLNDLLDSDSIIYAFVGNLSQKIFSGGRLQAEVDASLARTQALAARYAGDVLNAMREVEDALIRERYARDQLVQIDIAVEEATAAEKLLRERYESGIDRLLVVLETERRLRASEERQVLARQSLWDARIDLFLALGGDWELPLKPTETHFQENVPADLQQTIEDDTRWAPSLDRIMP